MFDARRSKTPRAVLWDLDGVLVDSSRFHYEAFRRLLRELGRDLTEEQFRHELFGLRNDAILRRLLGEPPEERLRELAERKESYFRQLIAGRVQPLPGAVELVQRLREAGLRQAIVSSTPRANIELILRELALEGAFEAIVGEEDAKHGKPDPEGFLVAAERLRVLPEECVVIEDAPEGIEAAKRAGMRAVGVITTRGAEELSAAHLVVPSLEDPALQAFLA